MTVTFTILRRRRTSPSKRLRASNSMLSSVSTSAGRACPVGPFGWHKQGEITYVHDRIVNEELVTSLSSQLITTSSNQNSGLEHTSIPIIIFHLPQPNLKRKKASDEPNPERRNGFGNRISKLVSSSPGDHHRIEWDPSRCAQSLL